MKSSGLVKVQKTRVDFAIYTSALSTLLLMKIIIIGTGVGGLSAYHTLKKHLSDSSLELKLIDPRGGPPSPSSISEGAFTFAPNGLRAIGNFSPRVLQQIQKASYPGSQVFFYNSGGSYLGNMPFGRKEIYGHGMSMIPRSSILQALTSGVGEKDIQWGSKVVSVREMGTQVEVEYADGRVDMADLVIGADGAQSVVRNALFKGEQEAQYQ